MAMAAVEAQLSMPGLISSVNMVFLQIATCQSYSLFNYNKKRDNRPACPSQCMAQTNNYMVMRFEELNSERDIIRALDQGSFVIAGMKVTDEFKRI